MLLPKFVIEVESLLSEEPIFLVESRLVLGNEESDRTDVRDGIGGSDLIVERRGTNTWTFVSFFCTLKFIFLNLVF